MARVTNLLLNGMSGKMGNLVFRTINGKTFVHPYQKIDKTPSEAMSKHRGIFSMMMKFLNPIRPLIKAVNSNHKVPRRRFDKIFSENLRLAVKGEYPDMTIDYPKLVLSLGDLPLAKQVTMSSPDQGKLIVKWKYIRTKASEWASDRAFMACYSEDLKTWIFKIDLANRRSKASILDCELLQGTNVHVYFGFNSLCGTESSNSAYLGKIKIL